MRRRNVLIHLPAGSCYLPFCSLDDTLRTPRRPPDIDQVQPRGGDDVAPRRLGTLEGAEHHHHVQVGGGVERRWFVHHDRLVDQDAGIVWLGGGGDVGQDDDCLRVGPVVQDGVEIVRRCACTLIRIMSSRAPFTSPLAWGSLRREITLDRLLVEEIVHHYPDALMRCGFFYHGLQVLQYERPGLDISHPLTQPLDIVPRPAAHVDKERDVESAGVEKLSRREKIGPG